MPPPGWSSHHGGRNTSARYSVNPTGCVFWREFDSGCACWRFVAFTAWRRRTLPTVYTADVDGRRHLRSANTMSLVVPSTRHSTLGDRAFPAAAAWAWNDLPSTIRASPSLLTFRQHLETFLFNSSFDWHTNERFCDLYYVKCPCNVAKC